MSYETRTYNYFMNTIYIRTYNHFLSSFTSKTEHCHWL